MSQSVYGITSICGNDYPFCFEEESEKITVYIGMKPAKIPDNTDKILGQRLGMMAGGYTLYKLGVPLSNDCLDMTDGKAKQIALANQISDVEYFLENFQNNSRYSEMHIQFPELDYFMTSSRIFAYNEKQFMFSRVIDTVYNFSIQYRGCEISVSFNIKATPHIGVKAKAETISEVVLKFSETDDLDFLFDLYFAARTFFTFVFNRQNIGLRSAILIGKYPRKTFRDNKVVDTVSCSEQKLVLSQKYLEPLEDEKKIAKVSKIGLFSPRIKELFQLFFEEKVGDDAVVDGSSIHPSFKYMNLIDLEQSLHTTATFEHYTRTVMPEISSQETIDFFNDMEALIDQYIESVTGKKKKKAKSFKKSLRPQVSLEEKITKAYEGYSTWLSLKPILSEWFGDDIEDIAIAANLWRNELAHEKREYQPDINVIKAVRLVEHINYCIVLRLAGYNDEQIKAIVSEILTKPI